MELLLIVLVAMTVITVINAFLLPELSRFASSRLERSPKVSLLVPARNEAHNLPRLLPSLLGQSYPNLEIVLLDDHSTDNTRQVAESHADPKLRVLEGGELWAGWLGKPNACRQLAEAATGEILIFTDADTVWRPEAVMNTVKAFQDSKADALCAWPKQLFSGWVSTLVHPLTFTGIMSVLPTWRIASSQNKYLVSANGQMLAFRRACLAKIGGFETVKNSILEDIKLAQAVKASGGRFVLLNGKDDIACRMYTGNREALAGFSKNVFAGLEYNHLRLLLQFAVLIWLFTMPLVWLVVALYTNQPWQLPALALGLGVFGRFVSDQKFGLAPWLCLLNPFSVLMFLYIALVSVWRFHTGRNRWKGRVYDLKNLE